MFTEGLNDPLFFVINFINKFIIELKRKMFRLTGSEAKGLIDAYAQVYAPLEEEVDVDLLSQEIFEEIAVALISQGHSAMDVLEYFANVDDEVIVEDIIALSEGTLIVESIVSEEYIEEQMQQLDEVIGAALRLGGAALKAAKFAPKGANIGQRAMSALGGAGRAAQRISQQGTKASAVVRPALGKAVQAVKGVASKAGSAIGGAVSKVKGAAQGALSKLPGGSGGKLAGAARLVGKAALGGAAFEGGMRGVGALANKMGGGTQSAKTAPTGDKAKFNASKALGGQAAFKAGGGAAAMKKNPKLTAADVQKAGNQALFKAGGGNAAMQGKTRSQVIAQGSKAVAGAKPTAPAKPAAAPAAPAAPAAAAPSAKAAPAKPATTSAKPATGKLGGTSFERRTPTSAELKGAQAARAGGEKNPEKVLQAAQAAGKAQASVDADVAKANTPAELNKPAPAGTALAKEQERRKTAQTTSESYDAYDIVLEYLISNGHVDSVEEAHYLMIEMDSDVIQGIVEGMFDFLPKQRVSTAPANQPADKRNLLQKAVDATKPLYSGLPKSRTVVPAKQARSREFTNPPS